MWVYLMNTAHSSSTLVCNGRLDHGENLCFMCFKQSAYKCFLDVYLTPQKDIQRFSFTGTLAQGNKLSHSQIKLGYSPCHTLKKKCYLYILKICNLNFVRIIVLFILHVTLWEKNTVIKLH